MRKLLVLFLCLIILFLVALYIYNQVNGYPLPRKSLIPNKIAEQYTQPFFADEKVDFVVKFRSFKIGTADMVFKYLVDVGGKKFNQVIFNVNTFNIKDLENIYSDVENYLPAKIERRLNIWGKVYEIVEEYDQDKDTVCIYRILKDKRNLEHKFVIGSDINNVLLTVYKLRLSKEMKVGETMDLNFPTKKVLAKVQKIETINVPAGKFEAFVIETIPRQFKVWIGTDPKRLPLRIDGGVGLGAASMLMSKIETPE